MHIHPTKIRNTVDELYKIFTILDEYCENHSDALEINCILPLIKILSTDIDELNTYFINKCNKKEEL